MNHNMRLHHNVIPTIRNYIEAANFWRDARPWRGQTGEHDYRPLGKWRKDHLKIHKGYEDEIRLRYHQTDCVVYWPDGSIQIEAYCSVSTNTFVSELSPFKPDFMKAETLIWVPMKYVENSAITETGLKFPYGNVLRFKPVREPTYPLHWELHEDSPRPLPFKHRTLNRKEAKLALKDTNYYAFVPWANAVRSMLKGGKKLKPWERGDYELDADDIVERLEKGIDGWMTVLQDRGGNCLAHVRDAIYRTTTRNIIIETDVPCIQGYADYESFVGNTKKLDNY